MSGRDVYRFVNELDPATVQGLIDRLEFRGTDPTFTRLRDAYLAKLPLAAARRLLVVGCGSGVVPRALARRSEVTGEIVGADQSPVMIEAARAFAIDEGVADRVAFHVGDAHALAFPNAGFDVVVFHTVISHVTDPLAVLREAARIVRPGGTVALFDGDYASLTFAHPDAALGKAMDEALIAAVVNSPRVMRDLPSRLHETGLDLVDAEGHVFAEVGTGRFFANLAEAYAPMVTRAGFVPSVEVDTWLAEQRRGLERGTFFGACNYYAYVTRRADASAADERP